jgi:signal transduction histidine kinase
MRDVRRPFPGLPRLGMRSLIAATCRRVGHRTAWARYTLAVVAPVCALAIAAALSPALERSPSPPFLAAIILVAWVGGLGPALVAILLSALFFDYLLLPPGVFLLAQPDVLWLLMFTIVALVTAWLTAGRRIVGDERSDLLERERAARESAEDAAKALTARVVQQAAVARLGEEALGDGDAAALMATAVRLVATTLRVDFCKVLELSPDGTSLGLLAGIGWAEGSVGVVRESAGRESQAGYTLLANGPVIVEDLATETRFVGPPLLRDHGVTSGVSVIIGGRQQPFGVLGAYTRSARTFTSDDVHFLQSVANLLAMAIERRTVGHEREGLLAREQAARLVAEAAQRRSQLLAEVSTVLDQSLDYEVTLKSVARLTLPHLADWVGVHVLEDGDRIRRLIVTHLDPAMAALGEALLNRLPLSPSARHGVPKVLRTGEPEFHPEFPSSLFDRLPATPEDRARLRALGLTSSMTVPLQARGRVFGAMTFITAGSRRRYTRDDLALALDLAGRAALAVDNARLFSDAQKANRAKDEFLATLSHELRTPLQSMLGWVRLMRSGRLDANGMLKAMETIERNTKAQAQLIEDLLDVSRIIAGKLRLDLRPVNLASIAQAAADSIRATAEAKSIKLESAFDLSAAEVHGDPQRLEQVMWNLLSNAVKFTGEGGRVDVRLERAGLRARIVVRDTGRGISAELLPRIFDRFHQADSSTTRAHGGLGLGLAIVRHLVELHGGTASASSPGESLGATFTVELPLAVPRAGRLPAMEPDVPAVLRLASPLAGLRVLVVDDDGDTRQLLATALGGQGARVTTAASVAEAMTTFAAEAPHVVVSDISMPDEDGFALLRRVRGGDSAGVPVVAITAYARDEDREHALSAGFAAYMAKPFDPQELARVLLTLARAA